MNQNWPNGSGRAQFHAGDTVTFNDANNGHYLVTFTGSNALLGVTVNNSAGNYVFPEPAPSARIQPDQDRVCSRSATPIRTPGARSSAAEP